MRMHRFHHTAYMVEPGVRLRLGDNEFDGSFGKCLIRRLGHANKEYGHLASIRQEMTKDVNVVVVEADGKESLPFQHAPHCPCAVDEDTPKSGGSNSEQSKSPETTLSPSKSLQLRIGVVGLVRNKNGEYLITRRASHMRSFPNCWVFPGGRLDPGETLEQCCAREIMEETAVEVDIASLKPLCLWESVYPNHREDGTPKAHYLVVFYTALAREDKPIIRCNPTEVDASLWLSQKQLAAVVDAHKERINSLLPQDVEPGGHNRTGSELGLTRHIAGMSWQTPEAAAQVAAPSSTGTTVTAIAEEEADADANVDDEVVSHVADSAGASRQGNTNVVAAEQKSVKSPQTPGHQRMGTADIIARGASRTSTLKGIDLSRWVAQGQDQEHREVYGIPVAPSSVVGREIELPLRDVCGIYPNRAASGIGRGHFFAIQVLLNVPSLGLPKRDNATDVQVEYAAAK